MVLLCCQGGFLSLCELAQGKEGALKVGCPLGSHVQYRVTSCHPVSSSQRPKTLGTLRTSSSWRVNCFRRPSQGRAQFSKNTRQRAVLSHQEAWPGPGMGVFTSWSSASGWEQLVLWMSRPVVLGGEGRAL